MRFTPDDTTRPARTATDHSRMNRRLSNRLSIGAMVSMALRNRDIRNHIRNVIRTSGAATPGKSGGLALFHVPLRVSSRRKMSSQIAAWAAGSRSKTFQRRFNSCQRRQLLLNILQPGEICFVPILGQGGFRRLQLSI